ncbi:unnamed protein product, partial [marine sediment metagenome]
YLLLILSQYCLTACQRLEDEVFNINTDAANTLYQILDRSYGGGNDVCLYIKPEAMHSYRVYDSCLTINGIRPRNNVKEPVPLGNPRNYL